MILNSQITVSCDLFQLVFLEFSFHESEVVYMGIFVVFFGPVIKKNLCYILMSWRLSTYPSP